MAKCPACNNEVLSGIRWCGFCHTNVLNPELGRLAPPIKRLGAFFLDMAIPVVALLFITTGVLGSSAAGESGVGFAVPVAVLLLLFYGFWAFRLFAGGQTPGKRLLGLQVITEEGRKAGFFTMLIREWIGRPISGMLAGLGYIWILIDQGRQGWHDKLLSTYVVQR